MRTLRSLVVLSGSARFLDRVSFRPDGAFNCQGSFRNRVNKRNARICGCTLGCWVHCAEFYGAVSQTPDTLNIKENNMKSKNSQTRILRLMASFAILTAAVASVAGQS